MIRTTAASIGGFVLVFIEAYIVLILKGFETLDFGGISPFVRIWSMNFFLLFSIFTHIKPWIEEKMEAERKLSVK